MMDYTDFYKLATFMNEMNRGKFTPDEIAESAHIYTVEFESNGTDSEIIKSLIELLTENAENGDDESQEWIDFLTF